MDCAIQSGRMKHYSENPFVKQMVKVWLHIYLHLFIMEMSL